MDISTLASEVMVALRKAQRFLLAQVSETRPAWGPEPGSDMDPWPSAQIVYFLPRRDQMGIISRTLNWLVEKQDPAGSWTSNTYGSSPDTSSTACCTVALLHHCSATCDAAQRGLQWLCEHYRDGWANLPTQGKEEPVHYYDTAYALRALARASRQSIDSSHFSEGKRVLSLHLHEGKSRLLQARTPRAGWGFRSGEQPDPSFTAYVLHGLLDVRRLANIDLPVGDLVEALNWLAARQHPDGAWSDWQGIETSPEATAYAVYVLLSSGVRPGQRCILNAIRWLLDSQRTDGGWGLHGKEDNRPINWLTNVVASGLSAFLLAVGKRGANGETVREAPVLRLAEFAPANLDHEESTNISFFLQSPATQQAGILPSGTVNLSLLYTSAYKVSYNQIPYTRELDHTMYKALDRYVAQKLPDREIEQALRSGETIEVHGIYPTHFRTVAGQLQLSQIDSVAFQHKKAMDSFNEVRPCFFRATRTNGQRVFVLAVIPGRDYVLHYASMVRHLVLQRYTMKVAERLLVFRYPLAEKHLPAWTGLDTTLIKPRDRVLLGYISALREHVEAGGQFPSLSRQENDYYGSFRYALPDGSVLNLLGVKFCFWGSISEILTSALCELGATEILYVAKLGALTGPGDLFTRIFCPSNYYILYHDQIAHAVGNLPNRILTRCPKLDSGAHVSVPTVLEEDYKQRQVAAELEAQSIDNEIAQMARAIDCFNRTRENPHVAFSAIHFATDYVRSLEDQLIATDHDLSKMRNPDALSKKERILARIWDEVLLPYFCSARKIAPGNLSATRETVPATKPPTDSSADQLTPMADPGSKIGDSAVRPRVLRVGLIGAGNHSSENLLPALNLLPGVRLTAFSSRSMLNLRKLSDLYRIPSRFTNWRQLVDPHAINAVVVAATPEIHEEVLRLAMERGIHTFLEKPPASNLAALEALSALARSQPNLVTMVDYNFRFGTGYQKLLEVAAEGGSVACVKIRFLSNKPRAPLWGFSSVLRSYLYAVGIHALEIAVSLLGDVEQVSARVCRIGERSVAVAVLLTTRDGRLALLDLGNHSNRFEARIELVTSSGLVAVLDDMRCLRVSGGGSFRDERERFGGKEVGEYVIPSLRGGFGVGGYEGALAAFRDAIEQKKKSPAPVEGSLAVYRVMQEILSQAGE